MTMPLRHLAKYDHRTSYSGNVEKYGPTADVGGVGSPVGACGHAPGMVDVKISHLIFAEPSRGSNLSASCGRILYADGEGSGYNFTVYDKCKCTGLRQP